MCFLSKNELKQNQINFFFLNLGHFLDHLFLLIFATAAALRLTQEWNLSYAELIPFATPSFVAFGLCAIPAGWLADRWSRQGMMTVFFLGIGASSILASLSNTAFQMSACLTLIGVFAAIYHPVGLAMVVEGRSKTGVPLAVNGIFGNMGVACAALLTGFLIDTASWQVAFAAPGIISIAVGVCYLLFMRKNKAAQPASVSQKAKIETATLNKRSLIQVFAIIFFTTALGGFIFQSTTFSLPKVFDEKLTNLADTATLVGWYSFLVFSLAAFAQLVVGYLVDHHSVRSVFLGVAMLQTVFFALMTQLTGIMVLIVAIAFMLVVFGQIPINDVLVGRIAKSEWRSRAYSFRYIVTFSVMASTVPLIAWVHGNWGFESLFKLLSIAALLIFTAVLFLPKTLDAVMRTARVG